MKRDRDAWRRKAMDAQQLALPFDPPFLWIGDCGRCGSRTMIDDKYPAGYCQECVEEETEFYKEEDVRGIQGFLDHRAETVEYLKQELPGWA